MSEHNLSEVENENLDNQSETYNSDDDSSYGDVNEMHGGDESSDEEMETVDVTDNMLYLVLSAFLEDDESKTVVEHLGSLTEAVNSNTEAVNRVADQLGNMFNVLNASVSKDKSKEKTKSSSKKKVKKSSD